MVYDGVEELDVWVGCLGPLRGVWRVGRDGGSFFFIATLVATYLEWGGEMPRNLLTMGHFCREVPSNSGHTLPEAMLAAPQREISFTLTV